MTITIEQLAGIDYAAKFWAGEEAKPAASEVIDGVEYYVQYSVPNRKCHDSLPRPIACYKINGKRVSRAIYYGSARAATN